MWKVKRTVGIIQLLISALILLAVIVNSQKSDKPINAAELVLYFYPVVTAITSFWLICTPAPPLEPKPWDVPDPRNDTLP
jgi:hypothetical protein